MYLGMTLEGLIGLGALILLRRPIPLRLSRLLRGVALVLGGVLYGVGFGSVVWGRVALYPPGSTWPALCRNLSTYPTPFPSTHVC